MPRAPGAVRVVRAVLAVPAALAGGAAGLLGSFVHPLALGWLPVGLLVGFALTAAVVVTAGLLLGRPGAAAAAVGWLVVVLVLSSQRPEGDLVVPASGLGYTWLLGGTLLVLGCAALPYRSTGRPLAGR